MVVHQKSGLCGSGRSCSWGWGSVVLLISAHSLDQHPQLLTAESSNASREQQRAEKAQESPCSRTSRGPPRDLGPDGLDLV